MNKQIKYIIFLIIFFCASTIVNGQQRIGFSCSFGIGNNNDGKNSSWTLGYESTSSCRFTNIIPTIGVEYLYEINNWFNVNSAITFNHYLTSSIYNYYDHNHHYPSYESSNNRVMELFCFGIPLNLDFKYKKTHFIIGFNPKFCIDGSFESKGSVMSYDYFQGYVTTDYQSNIDYSFFGIIMYGLKLAISQELNEHNFIQVSYKNHKIKALLSNHPIMSDRSFEFSFGYYHYF